MSAAGEFAALVGEVNDLLCASNLLTWDSRTGMPPGATAARGRQLATLKETAGRRLASDECLRLVERAEREVEGLPENALERRAVAAVREASDFHRRMPQGLTAEIAGLAAEAGRAWAEARSRSDFAAFAPFLTRTIELQRRLADAIGYTSHPYEALLGLYEPGLGLEELRGLLGALRSRLGPLLAAVRTAPEPRHDFLGREYPPERQREFALEVVRAFGYDLERGRLDTTLHPFEISMTREDVRITTRYNPRFLGAALFGAMHEAGHALYEQGVAPELTRTALATDLRGLYAVGGASYGLHESQSRLYENRLGRSRAFWERWFPRLREVFSEQLADVGPEEFHRAVNRVTPGPIRVEADELGYDLHIALRVELEASLLEGSLAVADLPAAWREGSRELLGLAPPDDARGVLQDIHWSAGLFGSFPTYTVGNVAAAQLYEAARRELPDLEAQLAGGDYAGLRRWLGERVHRHGRRYPPGELLRRATGSGLEPGPYLAYLEGKYRALYGVTPP